MHTDKILMTTQGQKLLHMCTWDASSTHLFQSFEYGYSHAELTVYLSYRLINASLTCIRTMHESQGACSESIEVSWRSDLIPASCKRAWPICCNLVMKLVKCKLAKWCASVRSLRLTPQCSTLILYSRKLSREKTFANWWKHDFVVADCLLLPHQRMLRPKSLWRKLLRIATKLQNSHKFSPWKFSTIR